MQQFLNFLIAVVIIVFGIAPKVLAFDTITVNGNYGGNGGTVTIYNGQSARIEAERRNSFTTLPKDPTRSSIQLDSGRYLVPPDFYGQLEVSGNVTLVTHLQMPVKWMVRAASNITLAPTVTVIYDFIPTIDNYEVNCPDIDLTPDRNKQQTYTDGGNVELVLPSYAQVYYKKIYANGGYGDATASNGNGGNGGTIKLKDAGNCVVSARGGDGAYGLYRGELIRRNGGNGGTVLAMSRWFDHRWTTFISADTRGGDGGVYTGIKPPDGEKDRQLEKYIMTQLDGGDGGDGGTVVLKTLRFADPNDPWFNNEIRNPSIPVGLVSVAGGGGGNGASAHFIQQTPDRPTLLGVAGNGGRSGKPGTVSKSIELAGAAVYFYSDKLDPTTPLWPRGGEGGNGACDTSVDPPNSTPSGRGGDAYVLAGFHTEEWVGQGGLMYCKERALGPSGVSIPITLKTASESLLSSLPPYDEDIVRLEERLNRYWREGFDTQLIPPLDLFDRFEFDAFGWRGNFSLPRGNGLSLYDLTLDQLDVYNIPPESERPRTKSADRNKFQVQPTVTGTKKVLRMLEIHHIEIKDANGVVHTLPLAQKNLVNLKNYYEKLNYPNALETPGLSWNRRVLEAAFYLPDPYFLSITQYFRFEPFICEWSKQIVKRSVFGSFNLFFEDKDLPDRFVAHEPGGQLMGQKVRPSIAYAFVGKENSSAKRVTVYQRFLLPEEQVYPLLRANYVGAGGELPVPASERTLTSDYLVKIIGPDTLNVITTPDNVHVSDIENPVVPGAWDAIADLRLPTLSGCLNCFHMHWRWLSYLSVGTEPVLSELVSATPGGVVWPDGLYGGNHIIPAGSPQEVYLAVYSQGRQDSIKNVIDISPHPIMSPRQSLVEDSGKRKNVELEYIASSTARSDQFNLHGFFAKCVTRGDTSALMAMNLEPPHSTTFSFPESGGLGITIPGLPPNRVFVSANIKVPNSTELPQNSVIRIALTGLRQLVDNVYMDVGGNNLPIGFETVGNTIVAYTPLPNPSHFSDVQLSLLLKPGVNALPSTTASTVRMAANLPGNGLEPDVICGINKLTVFGPRDYTVQVLKSTDLKTWTTFSNLLPGTIERQVPLDTTKKDREFFKVKIP